jgi:hypothetical protein
VRIAFAGLMSRWLCINFVVIGRSAVRAVAMVSLLVLGKPLMWIIGYGIVMSVAREAFSS